MKNNLTKIARYNLSLAGEYRVCSELLKLGVFATVTFGNKKATDILAVGTNRRAAMIEVKSSNSLRFVTGFYQKYKTAVDAENPLYARPTFWVLYSVSKSAERFFVLTHKEMADSQAERNDPDGWKNTSFEQRAQKVSRGVDNVVLDNVKDYESLWDKIVHYCNDPI